jgi:hypothetical protein
MLGGPHLGNWAPSAVLLRPTRPTVGPATSFSLGEGNTLISASVGRLRVERVSRRHDSNVRWLLVLMFTLFVLGLASISLAPGVRIEAYDYQTMIPRVTMPGTVAGINGIDAASNAAISQR